MISLLCVLSVLGCSDVALGDAPARDRAGLIHFARAADSSFDRFSYAPSASQQAWMRSKYWRMRAYAPYFDSRTAWFGGAWSIRLNPSSAQIDHRINHHAQDMDGRFSLAEFKAALEGWLRFLEMPQSLETRVEVELPDA